MAKIEVGSVTNTGGNMVIGGSGTIIVGAAAGELPVEKLVAALEKLSRENLAGGQKEMFDAAVTQMDTELRKDPAGAGRWKDMLETLANAAGIGSLVLQVFGLFGL